MFAVEPGGGGEGDEELGFVWRGVRSKSIKGEIDVKTDLCSGRNWPLQDYEVDQIFNDPS